MRLAPMLATPARALPQGPEWTYEVKWDGYRALAVKTGGRVELVSRNGKNLTRDYPTIAAALGEREVRRLRLEGVIAKRRDSPYLPGQRSDAWVKVKFSPSQEFVIGGYTPTAASFDAVLVGYYDRKRLSFAGKVRAGFTSHL